MKLSPLEIRQISFSKSMRGYSCVEVDTFLEGLADDLEALIRENAGYKEQLEKQARTIAELEKTEGALTDTLVMAQKAMENAKANAHKEGELIIRQAEIRAEEITGEAVRRAAELQGEILELRKKRRFLVEKVRGLIQSLERDLDWEENEDDFLETTQDPTQTEETDRTDADSSGG